MNADFAGLAFRIALYVAGGALLLGLFRASRLGLGLLPLSRSQRAAVERVTPILGAIVVLAYCLVVIRSLFHDQPRILPLALAMILMGFVAAAWGPVKDLVSGVFLKAGRVCSPGDGVQVGDVSGRVTELGQRALCVETAAGELVVVPYSVVARQAVFKVPVLSGAQAHVFEMSLRQDVTAAESVKRLQRAAMRHHWSSLVRVPEVKLLGGRLCRVTVYPLTADHASEIESRVRQQLGEQAPRIGG